MKDELRKFINQFQFLTPQEVEMVIEQTNLRFYRKGTLLLSEGQTSKYCYAVIKGIVREFYIIDGIEKTTSFFTEGQPVNSFTSYSQQKPSKHYLSCEEDCVLTLGTQKLEDEMCERIPRLRKFIQKEVEKGTGELQDKLAFFVMSSPEQRFLNLMKEQPNLINRVAQHQIASYLGIKPESLSRIKKRLYQKEKA